MRILVRTTLCCMLLVPRLLLGQDEYEPTEPHYHWPVYPPFSPGSWAWPTVGWWHFPSLYQGYGLADQGYGLAPPHFNHIQPPQTIIIFAPASAPPADATNEIETLQPRSASQEFSRSQSHASPYMLATGSNLQQGPTLYLIALKEGVIRPALAYWVEGKVLRYVDLDRAVQDVSLNRVDRTRSVELNRQRCVPFHPPADE
jgi:hypothetical protein